MEILKWLRSEGCPWDEEACQHAAEHGHLDVLKWLRSEGCPWDESTCNSAARTWKLDVLKWAIDNGCPYNVTYSTRDALEHLGFIVVGDWEEEEESVWETDEEGGWEG